MNVAVGNMIMVKNPDFKHRFGKVIDINNNIIKVYFSESQDHKYKTFKPEEVDVIRRKL